MLDFLITLLPSELVSGLGILLTIVTLAFYIIEGFFGYRLIRSWISILGFFFGAIGGFRLSNMFFDETLYILIFTIISGIILSLLSYKVYLAGVFLIAAYSIFQLGLTLLPLESALLYLTCALLGILAGCLSVKYMRPAIIFITAFHGAIMTATQLPHLMAMPDTWNVLTLGFIIGIAGAVVQFMTSKK